LLCAVYGAGKLVDAGSFFARRFKISEVVIGAIIIGFGTSMPEFTVNVISSIHKEPALAITNVIGSNIFNILMILGVAAVIAPLTINDHLRTKDIPYNLIAVVAVGICGNEILLDGFNFSALIPSDGMVLLLFFGIFVYYTLAGAHENPQHAEAKVPPDEAGKTVPKSAFFLIFGLCLLVGGGEMIVQGATKLAVKMGLSNHFVGLLIVGPGTSFPELIATIIAVIKKKPGMAIGNIVGSNIFNIFCVLGLSAVICELPLKDCNPSILVCAGASLLLLIFALTGKRSIGKFKGICFLLAYATYIAYLIYQG